MASLTASVGGADWLVDTPPDVVQRLVEDSFDIWLERDEVVYAPGAAKQAYVLLAGRIGAWHARSAERADGVWYYITDVALTTVCLENVLTDIDYHGSMRVLSDTAHLLAVPAGALDRLLEAHPATGVAIARHVSRRLQGFTEQSIDLALLDTSRRLAKYLLRLADAGGRTQSMAQHDLAARLGMSRQSVNAALAKFVQRGWMVRAGEGSYQLVDREAVEQHAGECAVTGAEQFL